MSARRAQAMRASLALVVAVAGCSAAQLPGLDDGIAQPRIDELHPAIVLPSSRIDLVGANFADPARASTRLVLRGSFTPTGGDTKPVEVTLGGQMVDETHAFAVANGAWDAAFGTAEGHFDGQAVAQSISALDGTAHESPAFHAAFEVARTLQPRMTSVAGGSVHVNDGIVLTGDGFLLATGEGETRVVVDGCFLPAGTTPGSGCAGTVVKNVELVARPLPTAPWDRSYVAFVFSPAIAGIKPGSFSGTVTVRNVFADGSAKSAGSLPLSATILKPVVTAVTPTMASLGQYVDIMGGGFIGEAGDEVTLLHLTGTFRATGSTTAATVDLKLVPHFDSGNRLRYVLDEADALGRQIDLRHVSGTFTGQVTPIVIKGADEVDGAPSEATLGIAPLKQVVYVRFLPSYVDSLRLYGLAAADADVRKRVLAVAERDYAGINIEFRDKPPTDFAVYSQVDVEGPDPNALGLLGYDNTPGKDVGNNRLFDRIGGVNATTQSDGFPGYGGIFAENFMGFSAHPSSRVARLETDATHFDAIFDPVRPDTGRPVSLAEVRLGVTALPDGGACLGPRARDLEVACAVFVLGSLVGSTLTHEVGHSLGLADPTGEAFHDPGDGPNRLMDAGGARPFEERAELMGLGPAVFCDAEYLYLKTILRTGDSRGGDALSRPDCN
jgi:hypothetical protein